MGGFCLSAFEPHLIGSGRGNRTSDPTAFAASQRLVAGYLQRLVEFFLGSGIAQVPDKTIESRLRRNDGFLVVLVLHILLGLIGSCIIRFLAGEGFDLLAVRIKNRDVNGLLWFLVQVVVKDRTLRWILSKVEVLEGFLTFRSSDLVSGSGQAKGRAVVLAVAEENVRAPMQGVTIRRAWREATDALRGLLLAELA